MKKYLTTIALIILAIIIYNKFVKELIHKIGV
jgi:hypothetical protein